MNSEFAATVILYNPEDETYDNILSYANQVATLIVIDNSTLHNTELIGKLKNSIANLQYINNNENLGIATALNIGCNKALELGFEWILTMDQDSKFLNFDHYLTCMQELKQKEKLALVAANTNWNDSIPIPQQADCQSQEIFSAITSANFLNLKYFTTLGKFDDKLFIDLVDYDYSLQIQRHGYKILQLMNIFVKHNLGTVYHRKNLITGRVRSKIEHNPQRVYYFTRNYLYVAAKHRDKFPKQLGLLKSLNMLFIHQITKIILYEDQKVKKLKAKILGALHYLTNRFGKYAI